MPGTTIEQTFLHIDSHGGPRAVAGAELVLGNGQNMTVQAGGSENTTPPFACYTVLLDHDPPRFWKRFGDEEQLIYEQVPRLLVTHHVIRHGGAFAITLFYTQDKPEPAPITTLEEVVEVLSTFLGRSIQPGVLH